MAVKAMRLVGLERTRTRRMPRCSTGGLGSSRSADWSARRWRSPQALYQTAAPNPEQDCKRHESHALRDYRELNSTAVVNGTAVAPTKGHCRKGKRIAFKHRAVSPVR
jgi:hypothetical protein